MLYDTYTQIAGVRKPQKFLVITAVIGVETDRLRYEFTDLDTGEIFELSEQKLRDVVKAGILRRFDTSYTKRKHATDAFGFTSYVEEDQYECIMVHLEKTGIFPYHMLRRRAA